MTLAPYQGIFLTPGMHAEVYSVEQHLSSLIYGPLHNCIFLNFAVIDGAARDAGHTSYTTTLRQGLVMGIVTATRKWKQWDPTASDGTQLARGVLAYYGIDTQYNGTDADRYLASIIVKGNLQAKGVCVQSSSSWGLSQTGEGAVVRGQLAYNFMFDDDMANTIGTAQNMILDAAPQAMTTAGAVSVATYYTSVNTTSGSGHASTLADGTYYGQLKKIQLIVDGGNLVLTIASLEGGNTITFSDAGDYVVLRWNGENWRAIELGNDADGATAPGISTV